MLNNEVREHLNILSANLRGYGLPCYAAPPRYAVHAEAFFQWLYGYRSCDIRCKITFYFYLHLRNKAKTTNKQLHKLPIYAIQKSHCDYVTAKQNTKYSAAFFARWIPTFCWTKVVAPNFTTCMSYAHKTVGKQIKLNTYMVNQI